MPKQKPRQGAGLSWSRLSDGAGRRSLRPNASAASPLTQRRAAGSVAQRARPHKKPRQFATGLSQVMLAQACLPMRVGQQGGKPTNSTRQPHHRLHAARGTPA